MREASRDPERQAHGLSVEVPAIGEQKQAISSTLSEFPTHQIHDYNTQLFHAAIFWSKLLH